MYDSYIGVSKPNTAVNTALNVSRGQKRKRSTKQEDAELDTRPIHIHNEHDTGGRQPQRFRPLKLIARAHLPLSFLQPGLIQHKRFLSRIACLEGVEKDKPHTSVLLLEDDSKKLHAIERVDSEVYAVCQLADRITLADFDRMQKRTVEPRMPYSTQPGQQWWANAALQDPLSPPARPRKAPTLQMLVRSSVDSSVTHQDKQEALHVSAEDVALKQQGSATADDTSAGPEEASVIFLRHYLDMLYKSKTSVAYLAKAHIPRLRNSMNVELEAGRGTMIDFLQALLLSSSTFDKKHKSLWPDKVKEILPSTELRSEDIPGEEKKGRKKKPKVKPDKSGCLPGETDYFIHWWMHGEDTPPSNETNDRRYQRRSLGLRTREAFLQLIIMLELASLQALDHLDRRDSQPDAKQPKAKGKNLSTALEILVDKLCIWHSVDSAVAVRVDDNDMPVKKRPDQLREFCIEVIVPFYMSKSPETAASVNKKLGGPSASSPSKRQKTGQTDNSKTSSNARREPLQRVTSERQTTKRHGPSSTSQAAKDARSVPGLKREPSEVSLDTIPLKNCGNHERQRPSLLDKIKLRQREVDFDAMSQVQESRRKKQIEVEDKLKEAISALKRPNRVLAGRELADVAEQRELMAQAREKASKSQRARQRQQQIQVDATPKHSRLRPDLITTTPPTTSRTSPGQAYSSSAVSRIPASGAGPQSHELGERSILDSGHRPRHRPVDATPLQDMTKFTIPESVIRQPVFSASGATGVAGIAETPMKPQAGGHTKPVAEDGHLDKWWASTRSIQHSDPGTTNIVSQRPIVAETPKRDAKATQNDVDIYAALGWDD